MPAVNSYRVEHMPLVLPLYRNPKQYNESPVTAYGNTITFPATVVQGQIEITAKGQTWQNKAGAGDTSPQTVSGLDAGNTYLLVNSESANVSINTTDTVTPAKITGSTSFDFAWTTGKIAVYELSASEAALAEATLGERYRYISGVKSVQSFSLASLPSSGVYEIWSEIQANTWQEISQ